MGIKVMATRMGQFGPTAAEARLYNEGEVFEVKDESQLGSWMERLDGGRNPATERIEKNNDKVNENGIAPIDVTKIKSTVTPNAADKLAAAKKAKSLKAEADKKAKELAEDAALAKSLI